MAHKGVCGCGWLTEMGVDGPWGWACCRRWKRMAVGCRRGLLEVLLEEGNLGGAAMAVGIRMWVTHTKVGK